MYLVLSKSAVQDKIIIIIGIVYFKWDFNSLQQVK